jgi:hypothetical protein
MSADEKGAAVLPTRPMPGNNPPGPPEGMRDYVVLLKEQEEPASPQGRAAIYQANVGRNKAFLASLERWLDEHDMRSQVAAVGELMGLEVITLTCTPAVAQAIKSFPEVELVVPDSDGSLRAIR